LHFYYTHTGSHINKNSFCGFYHAQTTEQLLPKQTPPYNIPTIPSKPTHTTHPIEQTALIGVDGVIYINVCHFSSFAQFAFHFFGSLNCRRHVIYWPSVLGFLAWAWTSGPGVPVPLLTLFCMSFSLFTAFCYSAESALCDV